MKLKNKTIVITGGGNGMGRELVLNLLKRENRVIALDINEAALLETVQLAGERAGALATLVVDISRKESVDESVDKVIALFGNVDVVINNAGIIQPFKKVSDLDFAVIKKVFDINFFGTLCMIRAFLPHLLTRPEAHIVNISSMGGFMPFPGQAVYGASKAAVKIMSESLVLELAATRVRVTTVFPGAMVTNITVNSGLSAAPPNDGAGAEAQKGILLPSIAAEMIIKGVEKNKNRIFIGQDSKMLDLLYRISPDFACKFIYKQMKSKFVAGFLD